jgi:GT2 family glycosyltransferase
VRRLPGVRDRYLRTWAHDSSRIVPWVLGAALGIRTQAFEAVEGFDESFFMYSEEVDLAYRLHEAGWQVHFSPTGSVVHVGGASTKQVRAQMLVRLYESLFRFARRHYSTPKTLGLKLVISYVMVRNTAHDVIALKRRHDGLGRGELSDNLVAWRRVLRDIWGRR